MTYHLTIESFREASEKGLISLMEDFHVELEGKSNRKFGKFNPRLDCYNECSDNNTLVTYLVWKDTTLVGYCLMYIAQNMHTQELYAEEDSIYIVPECRHGIGVKLAVFVLQDIKNRGIKTMTISVTHASGSTKLWKKIGFTEFLTQMEYTF